MECSYSQLINTINKFSFVMTLNYFVTENEYEPVFL